MQQGNRYGYAGDDPVNFTDVTGRNVGEDVIFIGAAIAFTGGIGLAGAGAISGLLGLGEFTSGFFAGATTADVLSLSAIAVGAVTSFAGSIISGISSFL